MKKSFFILISFFCLLNAWATQEKMVINIPYVSQERVMQYIESGYDVAQVFPHKNEVHIVVNEIQKQYFEEKYGNVGVSFTESQMRENLNQKHRGIYGYNTYTQIVEKMREFSELFPTLCELIEFGPTQGKLYFDEGNINYANFNHNVYGVKLSDNVEIFQDKPNYYFMGSIHAREPLAAEVCLTILDDLLWSYDPSNSNHPLNQSQIWIIPVLNPDGHEIVISQLDIWHRKTIYDNNQNGILDLDHLFYIGQSIDGIDGNRNFDYKFGTSGVVHEFEAQTYPGAHPFSAIETTYVRDLAKEVPFIAGINYHTWGNMVLYPYGHGFGAKSHNHEAVKNLAEEIASRMPKYYDWVLEEYYDPMPAWELYPTSGTSQDYMHYTYNTIEFIVELADMFIPSPIQVDFHKQNQLEAAYYLLDRHKNQFLTGIVKDALTGNPLKAEIRVFPIDNFQPERANIYSDSRFGRFNYPLIQGNYQLSVRAENYHPFLTDFVITYHGQTVVNVSLQPATMFEKSFILSHSTNPEIFHNAKVILEHTRTDTLFTNNAGQINVSNLSPGELRIIVKGNGSPPVNQNNDIATFITEIFLTEQSLRQDPKLPIVITFDDFVYFDEFTSFANNWTAINWTISTNQPYSGNSSAYVTNFVSGGTLTSINPILIPSGERIYISFMANKINPTFLPNEYIEVFISNNRTSWQSVKQIRQTDGWEYFYFMIPENMYERVYIQFVAQYYWLNVGESSTFFLDMFTVSKGNVIVSNTDFVEIRKDYFSINLYPTPFNPETTIQLDITTDANVSINIYNIRGQLVKSVFNDFVLRGTHHFKWNGIDNNNLDVASGVYFYQAIVNNQTKFGKMVLMK